MNKWKLVRRGGPLALAMTTAFSVVAFAQARPSTVTVTVNEASRLARVPMTALGVNTAVWDGDLMDSAIPGLLRNLHATMLRYPGGSTSDVYNWETNTAPGSYAFPQNNFTNFMGLVRKAGAQPIITVNGGTGTAALAAAWVKDANVTHHYGVRYWEIGNELYGPWEAGNFANDPAGYAEKASTYIQAMKAVDPSIQIGVDLIAPGTYSHSAEWNTTVLGTLAKLGTLPDFVIVHWYAQNPGGENDRALLASTEQIGTMMSTLRQQLSPYGKSLPVFVTETNSVSSNPGRQTTSLTNALFLANDILDWLQSGASNVDWWALHNGATAGNSASTLYGTTNYGDYGLLSNGSSVNGYNEPPVNTPFPDYYGYEMLGPLAQPGATLVATGSSNTMVTAHASRMPNGDLSVMLVNRNPNSSYQVNINLEGFHQAGPVTEITYGEGSVAPQTTNLPPGSRSVVVQPYSLTDLILHGAGESMPGIHARGALTASSTIGEPTISPTSSQTVTTTFSDSGRPVNHANLMVQVANPAGEIVAQTMVPDVSLRRGQTSSPVSLSFMPSDTRGIQGAYTVSAFAFSQHDRVTLLADSNTGTFSVVAPQIVNGDVSVTTTLSAASVTVGTPVTITTTYVNNSKTDWLSNGLLNQYVYANGNFDTQFPVDGTLGPGQTVTNTATFTPTASGTYTFPVGLFTDSFGFLQWFPNSTLSLTVTK